MCEALKLDPKSKEAKEVWLDYTNADRALRQFYQSELEAIALYFHNLKESDTRYQIN